MARDQLVTEGGTATLGHHLDKECGILMLQEDRQTQFEFLIRPRSGENTGRPQSRGLISHRDGS